MLKKFQIFSFAVVLPSSWNFNLICYLTIDPLILQARRIAAMYSMINISCKPGNSLRKEDQR